MLELEETQGIFNQLVRIEREYTDTEAFEKDKQEV